MMLPGASCHGCEDCCSAEGTHQHVSRVSHTSSEEIIVTGHTVARCCQTMQPASTEGSLQGPS